MRLHAAHCYATGRRGAEVNRRFTFLAEDGASSCTPGHARLVSGNALQARRLLY